MPLWETLQSFIDLAKRRTLGAVFDALAAVNVPVETGNAALQLIVPVMFVVISARLLANGIGSLLKLQRGEVDEPEVVWDGDHRPSAIRCLARRARPPARTGARTWLAYEALVAILTVPAA